MIVRSGSCRSWLAAYANRCNSSFDRSNSAENLARSASISLRSVMSRFTPMTRTSWPWASRIPRPNPAIQRTSPDGVTTRNSEANGRPSSIARFRSLSTSRRSSGWTSRRHES